MCKWCKHFQVFQHRLPDDSMAHDLPKNNNANVNDAVILHNTR